MGIALGIVVVEQDFCWPKQRLGFGSYCFSMFSSLALVLKIVSFSGFKYFLGPPTSGRHTCPVTSGVVVS